MKRFVTAMAISAVALGGSSACATKKMVKQRVGEVDNKVDTLSKSVEETQQRTRANEGRIGEVDQKAQAANQRASAAGQRADEAYGAANKVNARADAIEASAKRLVFEVVLSEDKGGFKFNQAKMPADMQAQIDQIVTQLKANPNGGYIEIEGHTDNVGPKDVNYKVGLERAEAVKRYLYENQQIPLHKINVISYGEEKPIAPNKTKAGRSQNRRVVIKVLA
ncbi:MAG TPA: OmpA family protein [Vicinamibacterales bacterium]|jgi:peptidoglycan-associated lipoprotein|nr:OmpA family protein [Vicinamibacterales bacterium]